MQLFSQSKGERDKSVNRTGDEIKLNDGIASGKTSPETVSALGGGMVITGNIVCAGSMQVFGRVIGDIHAGNLIIGEGAHVEGNVIALETAIHGAFKGTIHANSVKLHSTAMVDGEILNGSLTIEQNAQFEGVARRLAKPVDAPSREQANGESPASVSTAEVVSFSGALS
ncbi:MAG TPA: polymer-forming cytoskeletal protein [Xanthobacteraceae bacterium]|nr:polymer-forming cytoskeletal protein [Xanthobacteraceae bacterium]